MATRQYIGARYVPKFADPIEWDNARSYEALEIVTYLGTSYTSKKSVPVGTAITNSEYWVATGNYNAQVEEYRQEVEALNDAFDVLSDEVFNGYKNIILIGDSYGTANGGGVTISNPLPELIQSYLGLDNDHFRASFVNGAGFGNGGFYNQFNAISATMTDDEKADVTDIYFLGGWNDESTRVTQSQFLTGVQNCETLIASKFTHATKHVVFISHSTAESTLSHLSTTIGWYDSLITRGWAVDRNMRYILINPNWVISDGAHPNQDGVNALAKYFCDVVYSGQTSVNYDFLLQGADFSYNEGFASNFASVGGYIRFNVNDGETGIVLRTSSNAWVIYFIDDQNQETTKTIACNGAPIYFIELTNKIPGYGLNVEFPVTADIYTSDNTRISVNGYINFAQNSISFRPGYVFNSAHTGPQSIVAKSIVITAGSGTVGSYLV